MNYTRINRSFVSRPTRVIDAALLRELLAASRPCLPPPASGLEALVEIPTYYPVRVGFCPEGPETSARTDENVTIVPPTEVVL